MGSVSKKASSPSPNGKAAKLEQIEIKSHLLWDTILAVIPLLPSIICIIWIFYSNCHSITDSRYKDFVEIIGLSILNGTLAFLLCLFLIPVFKEFTLRKGKCFNFNI